MHGPILRAWPYCVVWMPFGTNDVKYIFSTEILQDTTIVFISLNIEQNGQNIFQEKFRFYYNIKYLF